MFKVLGVNPLRPVKAMLVVDTKGAAYAMLRVYRLRLQGAFCWRKVSHANPYINSSTLTFSVGKYVLAFAADWTKQKEVE